MSLEWLDRVIAARERRETQQAVDEPGEHWFNTPRCPHCGDAWEEWWDSNGLSGDEATAETTCGRCGKAFAVEMRCWPEFRTERK